MNFTEWIIIHYFAYFESHIALELVNGSLFNLAPVSFWYVPFIP